MRPWQLLALSIVTLLAACSGGGSSSGPAFVPQQPSASTAATVSYALTGAAQTIALPNLAACHGSVTLPATVARPAATILTLTTSLTAPAGSAILSSSSRRPAATGRLNVLCYVTFSVSTAVTLLTVPGFAVNVSPAVTSAGPQQYYYAISQPVAAGAVASYRTEGPATVDGQTLTFSASAESLKLAAHQNYVFAFYATSTVGLAATRLYVANLDSSISVFDLEHGNALLTKITGGGLSHPVAMAVDASGKLYVANGSTTINIFDTIANGNKPLTPIIGGNYTGLAIDADGKLFAASPGALDMYDTQSRNDFLGQIVDVNLGEPHALTIGASGILYALRGTLNGVSPGSLPLGISEYDTRHQNAILPSIEFNKLPIAYELLYPQDISVDPAGKIYVADFEGNVHVIDTAHANAVLPDVPAQYDPLAAKIDASGKLYVAVFEQSPGPNPKIDIDIVDTVNGNVKSGVVTGPNLGSSIAIH